MYPSTSKRATWRTASIFLSFFALAGCLPTGETDETDSPDETPDVVETEHQLTGSVGDGPIVAATIQVRAQDGMELSSISSGTTASYDVTVRTRGSYYPLRVDAIGGTDLVTQSDPDFTLRSAVLKPGNRSVANINPFTTFAIEAASDLPGGRSEANIRQALSFVTRELNAGLQTMNGVAALDVAVDAGNIADLVRASEAVGETVRRTRDALSGVGTSVSGDYVVSAIGSDLTDGIVDGRGGPGTDARVAAVFSVALAQVSLETMRNELRVQGVDSTARMNDAMAQVFAGTPSPALDELTTTAEAIDAISIGLLVVEWLQPSAQVETLASQVRSLAAGMPSQQVRSIVPSDGRVQLDAAVLATASAPSSTIDAINGILRSGVLPSDNNPPTIGGSPATTIDTGAVYSFVPTAVDADGDALTFTIVGLPQWASFDSSTGALTGIPGISDAGVYQGITISVSDGESTASLPSFTISVVNPVSNTPPGISGAPAATATVGQSYSFTPSATDADGDSLTFTIASRPTWASFDPTTGTLSGTPDAGDVGVWSSISIGVTDGTDSAFLPPFAITVAALPPVNTAPTISGNPAGTVTAGEQYLFQPSAADADGDALTFSITGLPAWAGFNSSTGRLSGTPDDNDVGTWNNIRISVSDGDAQASLPAFAIAVEASAQNTAPLISGSPATSVTEGNSYSFTPTASDADGDALTFSISGRPSWASFSSSTGQLNGVPGAGDVGTWGDIVISVSDGNESSSLASFDIMVVADNAPPPILGSIPDVPFNFERLPGPVTTSGSLPSSISAGEVLAFSGQTANGDVSLTCNGTELNPAFIVGGTLQGSNDVITISGSWCYFVDTVFNNIQVRTTGDHLVFRNIEVFNVSGKNGSSFGGSNIVVVDSEIHHNQGDDRHGIHVRAGADSVWILGNYIHHNGGDGFQACHGCSANPPQNVYLGNNLFHSDRENAIDFKYINNVIVEGNTIHSLVSAPPDQEWCFDDGSSCGVFSSGSDGSGIVVGSDGGPTNVLIIDNEIYGTVNATRIEEGTQIRVENNNFHDLTGRCLQLDKNGMNTVFSGNTCRSAARGIWQNWRQNFSLTVDSNTFENLSGPAIEYESGSVGNASTLTSNQFINTGPVIYSNTTANSEAEINSLPGAANNQVQ